MGATTHHGAFDALAEAAPNAVIHRHKRIVDNGKVVLSGGISAGIDASFHVVSRLHGETVAQETAKYMEYDWRGDGSIPSLGTTEVNYNEPNTNLNGRLNAKDLERQP